MISVSLRNFDVPRQPVQRTEPADEMLNARDVAALLHLFIAIQRTASDETGWEEVAVRFASLCESVGSRGVAALRAVREYMPRDATAEADPARSQTLRYLGRDGEGDAVDALRGIIAPAIARAVREGAAETRRAHAEARLELCFEHCVQGMMTFAADGTCLFLNRAAARLLKLVVEPRQPRLDRRMLHRSVRKLVDEFVSAREAKPEWLSVRSLEIGGERVQCLPLIASRTDGEPAESLLHLFLIAEASSDDLAARLLRRARLSKQETVVARALIDGKSNATIAGEMSLSAHTVRTYTERIYEKLEVRNRHELMKLVMAIAEYPAPEGTT